MKGGKGGRTVESLKSWKSPCVRGEKNTVNSDTSNHIITHLCAKTLKVL